MVRRTISALAIILALAACTKENATAEKTAVSLSLSQENIITRAAINSENAKQIIWSAEDRLSVFDQTHANNPFTLSSGAGTAHGTFKGTVSQTGSYTVLCPYQDGASFDGTAITNVTLASTQNAVAGSFDPAAAIMCGVGSAEGSVQLKNAVGYLKITPGIDCTSITLASKDDNQWLSGTLTLTVGEDGIPSVSGGTQSSVTLSGDIKAGSTYYMAVVPVALKSGFVLSFTAADGTVYSRESEEDKVLTIERNSTTDMGAVTKSSKHTFASGDFGLTGEVNVDLYKIDGPATTSEGYKWYLEPTMNEPIFYWKNWGLQIGIGWSANTDLHVKSMRLYTPDISGTIKAVKVTCSDSDSSKQAEVSVKVDGNAFGSAQKLSNDMTTFAFTGSASGQIEILWNSEEDGIGYYLQSVEVIYQN